MSKLLLILLLLMSGICFAKTNRQATPYIVSKILNTTNGLPQNSIKSLHFNENNGLLWIATQSGLVRYDGQNCKIYDADNLQNLASNRIVNILPVWGKTDAFTNADFSNYISISDFTPKNHVVKFPLRIDGALCSQEQLESLWNTPPVYEHANEWLRSENRLTILPQSEVDFSLLVNDSILYGYRGKKLVYRRRIHNTPNQKLVLYHGKPALMRDDLTGTIVDPSTGKEEAINLNTDISSGSGKNGKIFYHYPNQLFWQKGTDIFYFDLNENDKSYPKHFIIPETQTNFIQIYFVVKDDILLLGSATKGLSILRPSIFSLLRAPIAGDDQSDANNTTGQVIVQDSLLFTSGANLFNLNTKTSTHLSLPVYKYSALSTDAKGNIYFTNQNNIYSYNALSGSLRTKDNVVHDSIDLNPICTVSYEQDGKFWVSSRRQISYLDQQGFTVALPMLSPIISRIGGVGLFTQDAKGTSYFTGQGSVLGGTGGLYILDKDLKKCQLVTGTQNWNIRFIRADEGGNCWIGTYGIGWYLYNTNNKEMTALPIDERRHLYNTHAIVEDSFGYIWVTTNNGLFQFQKAALLTYNPKLKTIPFFRYFSYLDGLPSDEFNGGGQPIYNWWKGNLLLSCVEGITMFRPDKAPLNTSHYPIFIDEVTTNQHNNIKNSNGVYSFTKDENNIQWVIQRATWDNGYGAGIEYRLDDDSDWQIASGQRPLINVHANGGNHSLYLRYRYGFGINNYVHKEVQFSVAKKIYEYVLFWVVLIVFGGLFFYAFILFRTRRLSRKSKELEGIVDSRTQDLQIAYRQVQEMLAEATNARAVLEKSNVFKTRIVSLLSHDLMTPLASITTVSAQLEKYQDLIEEQTRNNALHEINNTSMQLVELCTHMLQWAHVQQRDGKLILTRETISDEVEKAVKLLNDSRHIKQNTVSVTVPPGMSITTDFVIFQHILLNLLSNANKFTSAGHISVAVDVNTGTSLLTMSVKDSGVGMPSISSEKIMQHVRLQSQAGTNQERGWGLGYEIIGDLLLLVNGALNISSSPGEGTLVTVSWKVEV